MNTKIGSIMTIRQTAHAMIDSIQNEDDIRFLIEIMGRLWFVTAISTNNVKKNALLAMEKLRSQYSIPSDLDYDTEREIALKEKSWMRRKCKCGLRDNLEY